MTFTLTRPSHDQRATFWIREDSIVIQWPDRITQRVSPEKAVQILHLLEETGFEA